MTEKQARELTGDILLLPTMRFEYDLEARREELMRWLMESGLELRKPANEPAWSPMP